LCQHDCQLGTLPRDGGPGNRYENFESSPQHFLSIDTAGDSDRKRPAELDCAACDLLVESVAFGGRLAADEQEPVALFGLGADRLLVGLLDSGGNLDRILPGSSGLASSPSSALFFTAALVSSA
jgi:hypothetical protein